MGYTPLWSILPAERRNEAHKPQGGYMTQEIALTQGFKTQVDDEDYERLSDFIWYAHPDHRGQYLVYVHANHDGRTYLMHRMIMGLKHGDRRQVDHINHDCLDNRRQNLRIVTHSENLANRRRVAIPTNPAPVQSDGQTRRRRRVTETNE